MRLDRRQILIGSSSVCGTAALGATRSVAQPAMGARALPIPPLIDASNSGGKIALTAQAGQHAFEANRAAQTYGFSQAYLGPVLRVRSGTSVEMAIKNTLAHDITCHWHGLLVPGDVDGGCHQPIRPGATWQPKLNINQPEATAWYHSHAHHDTGRQVYMGLSGMIIVDDGTGERLGLPRTYGVDDLPLLMQDRRLDGRGELAYANAGPSRMMGMRGETLVVNGAVAPVARVPAGLVRLRLLNGANARNFDLSFSDGRAFHVIASDGGYLPAPVAMTSLVIAPSERFEVLVDFGDGREAALATKADSPMMGMGGMGGMGRMGGMAMSDGGMLMRFEVDRSLPVQVQRLPVALVPAIALPSTRGLPRRRISLDMGPAMMGAGGMGRGMGMGGMGGGMGMGGMPMGINGKPFEMDRIDFRPKLGSTEVWDVNPNMMAHPFHVHGVTFRVLSIGGKAPPAHLAGGKETVLLDAPGEIVMTFTQPASAARPFMYHCHILEHEDAGMMGLYATS